MNRTKLFTGVSVVVATGLAAVLGTATPGTAVGRAAAKPTPSPSPTATVPPPPEASGCYSIVAGQPGYQRILANVQQSEVVPGTGLYNKAVITLSDRSVVFGGIVLEAPSCPEATYVVEVYSSTPTASGVYPLLAKSETKGTGQQALALDTVLRGYTDTTVRVEARVLDAFGREIDNGSEGSPVVLTAEPDGASPGNGGTVAWR